MIGQVGVVYGLLESAAPTRWLKTKQEAIQFRFVLPSKAPDIGRGGVRIWSPFNGAYLACAGHSIVYQRHHVYPSIKSLTVPTVIRHSGRSLMPM
jgi:hypothetical protein